ncbi:MAG: histone family protein DNA-binding protein [Pseudonocardia sp.]|nr:histone family protein DNA-binding protein [Pseudonocardia sp.]
MNKSQLVDALSDRLGDRRTAAGAVDAILEIVVDTVQSGESVSLAGFGVFESRARAARLGRNPRTGESVAVPATTVPAFRPGTGFRQAVAGTTEAAADVPAPRRGRGSRTAGDTNGSLNGVVDAVAVPTTALATAVPDVAQEGTTKAGSKDKGKKAKASAPKNDSGKNSDKGKKGKKGKK